MKNLLTCLALSAAAVFVGAAPATATLSVPSMNCPECPITVKKALTKLNGGIQTKVDVDKRQATVTFDNARTDGQTLTLATKNVGYPSTLVTITK